MFDPDAIERTAAARRDWEARELREFLARQPEARAEYRTASGLPRKRVYTPEDVAGIPLEDIGLPGRPPFTRGPYPTMYRGRPWTMRQIAGFGTGEDTNGRFRYLIEQGQTGLSVDFDMPTLMGYDSDDPRALGEVGREGVAVDSLADMETLFAGIDLGKVSTSMTINLPAPVVFAMYIALAKKQGGPLTRVRGTCQTDILKEYIAQNEYLYPPEPSMRLVVDALAYCSSVAPNFYPITVCSVHQSEFGANHVSIGKGFIQIHLTVEAVNRVKNAAREQALRGADAVHLASALMLQSRFADEDDRGLVSITLMVPVALSGFLH